MPRGQPVEPKVTAAIEEFQNRMFQQPRAVTREGQIRRLLTESPPIGEASVSLGDARSLRSISNQEVDAVLTSPPYSNAIDYMCGHRLSLVWLGYSLSDLRSIRSNAIGTERGPDHNQLGELFREIQEAMGPIEELSNRDASMVARYAEDIYRLISEPSSRS